MDCGNSRRRSLLETSTSSLTDSCICTEPAHSVQLYCSVQMCGGKSARREDDEFRILFLFCTMCGERCRSVVDAARIPHAASTLPLPGCSSTVRSVSSYSTHHPIIQRSSLGDHITPLEIYSRLFRAVSIWVLVLTPLQWSRRGGGGLSGHTCKQSSIYRVVHYIWIYSLGARMDNECAVA
jgi:hypothetical protein